MNQEKTIEPSEIAKLERSEIRKLLESYLAAKKFDRVLDLWLAICRDNRYLKINPTFQKLCQPYEKGMGFIIYKYYREIGIDKISPLLNNDNLDIVIGYLDKALVVIKKPNFFKLINELYDRGFRSERLLGLYLHEKAERGDLAACWKILEEELRENGRKINHYYNLSHLVRECLNADKPREAKHFVESFLEYEQKNAVKNIFFKNLIDSCIFSPKIEINNEVLTDLELLFDRGEEKYFNSLLLRLFAANYRRKDGRSLELIDRIEYRLKNRGNLDGDRLEKTMRSLRNIAAEFQNYLYRDTKPTYKEKGRDNLKVALCISGQLRGYEKAFQSWQEHIIERLNPDIFVHTWTDIGFKQPAISHAHRIIDGSFLSAYKKVLLQQYSPSKIAHINFSEDYPAFKKLLDSKNRDCTWQELNQLYQTQNIAIEDDREAPFTEKDNQMKMLYKVEACDRLHKNSGVYDLVIRIRPDLEIKSFSRDWWDIYQQCYECDRVFINRIKGSSIISAGDVFAVGTEAAISWYASLNELVDFYSSHKIAKAANYVVHKTLFWHIWYGGFSIASLNLDDDLLTPTLASEEIYRALSQDINLSTAKDYEVGMLRALENDLQLAKK